MRQTQERTQKGAVGRTELKRQDNTNRQTSNFSREKEAMISLITLADQLFRLNGSFTLSHPSLTVKPISPLELINYIFLIQNLNL